MGAWSPLVNALGGPIVGPIATSFMGAPGKEEKDPNMVSDAAGSKSPGWTGDTKGVTKAPPSTPQEPATEPEEPRTKMQKVNQFLGTETGRIGTDIAGGFISDFRSQRNTRKNFKRLKDEGLTSVEIAGGGGASGAVSSQGNTLGSGPARQAASQQEFQRSQAQLERENKLKVAEIGARAAGRQAGVSEARSGREAMIAPSLRDKVQMELRKLRVEIERKKLDIQNLWPMKLASMGKENVMMSLAMFNSGLNLERILRAQGDLTPSEKKATEQLFNVMLKIQGGSGAAIGMIELFKQFGLGKGTLGRDVFQTLGTNRGSQKRTDVWIPKQRRNKFLVKDDGPAR